MLEVRRVPGRDVPVLPKSATLRLVLSAMNEARGLACLISEESGKVVNLLTDSDVRRILLECGSIDTPLPSDTSSFLYATSNPTQQEVADQMAMTGISHLPELGENGELLALWVRSSGDSREPRTTPVLILAGGKGLRLTPLTISTPKPLIKVGGTTLVDRTIAACRHNRFRIFYVSVNYMKDQVVEHFNKAVSSDCSITFVEEDTPLGTAGPVGLLPPESEGNLLVVNADVIHNVDLGKMVEAHEESGAAMTVAVRFHQTTIPFGVVEVEGTQIVRVTEKPALNIPVNAGMYVLGQQVRDMLPRGVRVDMPDLIEMVISEGLTVSSFLAHEYWIDVGTHESLALAESEIDQWNLGAS